MQSPLSRELPPLPTRNLPFFTPSHTAYPTLSQKGRKKPTMQNTTYTLSYNFPKVYHNFTKNSTLFTSQISHRIPLCFLPIIVIVNLCMLPRRSICLTMCRNRPLPYASAYIICKADIIPGGYIIRLINGYHLMIYLGYDIGLRPMIYLRPQI